MLAVYLLQLGGLQAGTWLDSDKSIGNFKPVARQPCVSLSDCHTQPGCQQARTEVLGCPSLLGSFVACVWLLLVLAAAAMDRPTPILDCCCCCLDGRGFNQKSRQFLYLLHSTSSCFNQHMASHLGAQHWWLCALSICHMVGAGPGSDMQCNHGWHVCERGVVLGQSGRGSLEKLLTATVQEVLHTCQQNNL